MYQLITYWLLERLPYEIWLQHTSKLKYLKSRNTREKTVGSAQSCKMSFLQAISAAINSFFCCRLSIICPLPIKVNLSIKEYQPINLKGNFTTFQNLVIQGHSQNMHIIHLIPSSTYIAFTTNFVNEQFHQVSAAWCFVDPISKLKIYLMSQTF